MCGYIEYTIADWETSRGIVGSRKTLAEHSVSPALLWALPTVGCRDTGSQLEKCTEARTGRVFHFIVWVVGPITHLNKTPPLAF